MIERKPADADRPAAGRSELPLATSAPARAVAELKEDLARGPYPTKCAPTTTTTATTTTVATTARRRHRSHPPPRRPNGETTPPRRHQRYDHALGASPFGLRPAVFGSAAPQLGG